MPRYRLQTLVEIRTRAKESAEEVYAQAVKALLAERKTLGQLEEDLRGQRAERKRKARAFLQGVMNKGAGAAGFEQRHRFEERLKEQEAHLALAIARQQEAVERAAAEVEVRRHQMGQAARELRAIQKHQEKWARQARLEQEAREELARDEIAHALHLMRSRK